MNIAFYLFIFFILFIYLDISLSEYSRQVPKILYGLILISVLVGDNEDE